MVLKIVLLVCCICSVRSVTNEKSNLNAIALTPKDAVVAPLHKDLKVDSTITHTSDPAPEFYRGSANIIQERDFDRNRYGPDFSKDKWLSLDRDSLYKNPYLANTYNRYTGVSSTPSPSPSVSSLMAPNSSYRDRYDNYGYNSPTANDYLGSKYGLSGGLSGGYGGAPYGPPAAVEYSGYGSGPGYDQYGTHPFYNSGGYSSGGYGTGTYNNPYGSSSYGGHVGYGQPDQHSPHIFSKFSKSSILPLAGAALLGVAATLVANPVLLNFGKRKRRSIALNDTKRDAQAQELAYRGHRNH